MRILAVDTSTAVCGVAVCHDGKIVSEYILNDGNTHSHKLVPMIDEVMRGLSLKAEDFDAFAGVTGPGSFTGLRIGIVTVKAMALAAGKPVIGITSLDSLAFGNSGIDQYICPMIDARNNQVYTAVYEGRENGDVPKRLTEYMAVPIEELSLMLQKDFIGKNIIICGDASEKYFKYFSDDNEQIKISVQGRRDACPASAAVISEKMLEAGNYMNADELIPYYLRKSSAEQMMDKRRNVNG